MHNLHIFCIFLLNSIKYICLLYYNMIMSEDKYPTSGIACNNQGLVTFFGQGAEELFGWKSDDVVGKQYVTAFHTKENIEKLVPRLLQTASEKGVFEEPVTLVKKDGSTFTGLLNVRPIKDSDGNQTGFIGTTTVTD